MAHCPISQGSQGRQVDEGVEDELSLPFLFDQSSLSKLGQAAADGVLGLLQDIGEFGDAQTRTTDCQ
jgi:hypothetical protein